MLVNQYWTPAITHWILYTTYLGGNNLQGPNYSLRPKNKRITYEFLSQPYPNPYKYTDPDTDLS